MRTIQEKYNAVLEGNFSKIQFLKDAKRELPQFLSPYNGFQDSVSILKSKGLLVENKKPVYDNPSPTYTEDALNRGIDYELEAAGIDSAGSVSEEEREKAKAKAEKNLAKDAMHYLNILAGESAKVDKHDKPVEYKKGKEVDTFNGMKKAELKEEMAVFSSEEEEDRYIEKMVKRGLEKEKERAAKKKKEVKESNQEESIADFIIQHYTNPKTGKSLIDDEIIGDFFKTHPESRDQEPQDALDNFEEYLSVNYEMPGDYMQEKVAKSVEDVIDPADYGEIGKGYLKGFNKPHSLNADDLEVLGRKVVQSLYKGDLEAAKAKFVKEAMSDDEMKKIATYGKDTDMQAIDKLYQLGDKFSRDFDYEGMLKAGLKVRLNTPVDKMQALFDSFEDVNYHREGSHLSYAIDAVKMGDKGDALDNLKKFRAAIKDTLKSFNEGASKVRKQLEGSADVEAVINERVGSLQEFIALIQDRAEENGTTEKEEAEEVMYAIGDHYNIGVDIMRESWDDDDEEELSDEDRLYNGWEEYKDGNITKDEWDELRDMYDDDNEWSEDGLNEGRRRKSQGGKIVTENDYDTGGYVESMGPIFDKAVNMLIKAWEEWKMGPMTEPGMIEFAKKDVLEYLETQLMVENLEETKGKDHDGDGDVDSDDYLAAKDKAIKKAMKENVKAIITKVLEEQIINEAATNALAEFTETYGGFEGMKPAIIALQDIVTDIESYYDKTRGKIQKVYDTLGEIRNEEGLKVGGFLAPSIEQAFNKDLRPAIKGGFTKGLNQPKVKMLTQKDIDMHNSGERPLGEEEKETVYSRPSVNGTLRENKK